MKIKESTTANVLRILFTVGMVITLGICTIFGAMGVSLFNLNVWENFFHEKKVKESFLEELDFEMDIEELNYEYNIDFDAEDYADACYEFIIPEFFEVLKEGDTELDDDKYDEFFDENIGEVLDDLDVPKSQIKEYKKDFRNSIEDRMEGIYDDMTEDDTIQTIFGFQDTCYVTAAVCLIISAVMFGVLIPLHKNKFTPVRNLGLAMIISQGLNALGYTGLWALIGKVLKSEASTDLEELLADYWNKGTGLFFLGFLALAVVGVVIMIVGINLKKNADNAADVDSDMAAPAAAPQPVA